MLSAHVAVTWLVGTKHCLEYNVFRTEPSDTRHNTPQEYGSDRNYTKYNKTERRRMQSYVYYFEVQNKTI